MRMAVLHRFRRNVSGNVSVIFAIVLLPLLLVMGMGIDYTSAARKRTKLNAAADAAALAAVTPAMLAQSATAATAAATSMFNAQVAQLKGLSYSPSNLSVAVADTGTTTIIRTASVSYSASSLNVFSGLLGMNSIALSGKSSSTVSVAPNIDFYVLLDTSPSMALPATSAGISTMIANTQAQTDFVNGQTVRGCAFACHQTNPSADNLGNAGGVDNYQIARNYNVTLRIDNVVAATADLATKAQTTGQANGASYRMAVNTFDVGFNTVQPLTSNLTAVANQTNGSNIQVLQVYKNNWLSSAVNNGDADTDWDNAMSTMNSNMPAPGGGTSVSGDTPQEVLFLVTDGMRDEIDTSYGAYARSQSTMYNSGYAGNGTSYDWCTTIKNRGIRIAVLYTTYISLYNQSSWYNTYIYPFQSNIAPTLQTCASPGLFTQVSTDQDISAALTGLFQAAVSTAHLTR